MFSLLLLRLPSLDILSIRLHADIDGKTCSHHTDTDTDDAPVPIWILRFQHLKISEHYFLTSACQPISVLSGAGVRPGQSRQLASFHPSLVAEVATVPTIPRCARKCLLSSSQPLGENLLTLMALIHLLYSRLKSSERFALCQDSVGPASLSAPTS